jgi:hypothetical protein
VQEFGTLGNAKSLGLARDIVRIIKMDWFKKRRNALLQTLRQLFSPPLAGGDEGEGGK